jgi:hypothetical protein
MILSLLLSFLGAYVFDNIIIVAVFIVISVGIRSYVSEFCVAKIMNSDIKMDMVLETIIVALFMFSIWRFNLLESFFIVLFAYLMFALINMAKIKKMMRLFLKK